MTELPDFDLSLIKIPPPTVRIATLDELAPHIEKIASEFYELATPESRHNFYYYPPLRDCSIRWSHIVRSQMTRCCATHLLNEMAEFHRLISDTVRRCIDNNCPEYMTHSFLTVVLHIINRNMNEWSDTYNLRQLTDKRVN